jgi:hypothetical protein
VTQAQPVPDGVTLPAGFEPQRARSGTFLQIQLTPEEPQVVRLDLATEQEFSLIVLKSYPELADNVHDSSQHMGASLDDFRLGDWYQLNYREKLRDHEMGWGIDSSGSIYFVTQVRCKVQEKGKEVEVWSLADLITDLDCTIEAAHRLWRFLNYPGTVVPDTLASMSREDLPVNIPDCQLSLFRCYVLVVQRVERFAGILWVPLSPAIPVLRVPVFRWGGACVCVEPYQTGGRATGSLLPAKVGDRCKRRRRMEKAERSGGSDGCRTASGVY